MVQPNFYRKFLNKQNIKLVGIELFAKKLLILQARKKASPKIQQQINLLFYKWVEILNVDDFSPAEVASSLEKLASLQYQKNLQVLVLEMQRLLTLETTNFDIVRDCLKINFMQEVKQHELAIYQDKIVQNLLKEILKNLRIQRRREKLHPLDALFLEYVAQHPRDYFGAVSYYFLVRKKEYFWVKGEHFPTVEIAKADVDVFWQVNVRNRENLIKFLEQIRKQSTTNPD